MDDRSYLVIILASLVCIALIIATIYALWVQDERPNFSPVILQGYLEDTADV